MPSHLKLYTNPLSGNAFKVQLLASLMSVPLQLEQIDFAAGQHHSDKFLAMNPRGQIPVLVVEGGPVLTDSAACLSWLAGNFSDKGVEGQGPSSWWSKDISEQSELIGWFAFATQWCQHLALARLNLKFPSAHPEKRATTREQIIEDSQTKGAQTLRILQTVLSKQDWLALGRPTAADVAVFVYVALAPMGGISLEPYPAVRAWVQRVRGLPGFIALDGMYDANDTSS